MVRTVPSASRLTESGNGGGITTMKVLYWSRIPFARRQTREALEAVPGIELRYVETLEECLAELPGAELLVTGDVPAPEAARVLAVASAEGLRAIHFISAGRDGFDAAGIPDDLAVTGPVGASAATVAEHAMGLTLGLLRQIRGIALATVAREWDKGLITGLRSLEGAEVLIVGLGHIGREYAQRVRAFGARTVGLQHRPRPDDSVDRLATMADLDRELPQADIVFISAALTAETAGLFDADRIARMKPGAILVNTARGGLVDTLALATAVEEGRLGGAGVDVTDPEPLPADHPLWGVPNVLVSPHFAGGGSPLALQRVGASAASRARELMEEHDRV